MRQGILLLAAMAAALVLASGLALAAVIDCAVVGNPCLGTPDSDTMTGTAGSDDMFGLQGGDMLNAGSEIDTLAGGRGSDTLNGEANGDTMTGGRGDDALNGAEGGDSYIFTNGWGDDTISDPSMSQADRLSFTLVDEPVRIDLISSAARDEARSGGNTVNFPATVSIVEVDGGSAGDMINGDAAEEFLNGIQGNDTVKGRGGVDTVVGAEGNDRLLGGSGGDTFEGGPGADRIEAVDNEADQIACGGGSDVVYFDQNLDTLVNAADCEDKRPK